MTTTQHVDAMTATSIADLDIPAEFGDESIFPPRSGSRDRDNMRRAQAAYLLVGHELPAPPSTFPAPALSDADVHEIRRRYRAGVRQCRLAEEFGISKDIVHNMVHGRTYRHVTDEGGAA